MHTFLQGEADLTIDHCSPSEHRCILGQWDFGKGCILQYYHEMHLGKDEEPSKKQGCYKIFSQPTFLIGSILSLLTDCLLKEMKLKSMISNQMMHNVIREVIPIDA